MEIALIRPSVGRFEKSLGWQERAASLLIAFLAVSSAAHAESGALSTLKPDKRTVKLFDIDAISCDQIGSFLINDVLDCKAQSGAIPDCLAAITPSSLTKAQLTK
jgi:hypothetical protein